jgi:threonine dehydratase
VNIAAPVLEECAGFLVVRDDLVPGGTKARILPRLLQGAAEEYVYASPAYGYAQVALAHSAAAMGKRGTVFTAKRSEPHARTWEAKKAGAKIVMVPHGYLSNVQAKARAYCQLTGAVLLPFGLDTPEFLEGFAEVARSLPVTPSEVWCAAGSGVLCRGLQMAWPDARVNAVQVGCDPQAGAAKVYKAPEKFEQDGKEPPPFPSCSNYDAKVWRFMRRYASPGALFWNVAA